MEFNQEQITKTLGDFHAIEEKAKHISLLWLIAGRGYKDGEITIKRVVFFEGEDGNEYWATTFTHDGNDTTLGAMPVKMLWAEDMEADVYRRLADQKAKDDAEGLAAKEKAAREREIHERREYKRLHIKFEGKTPEEIGEGEAPPRRRRPRG